MISFNNKCLDVLKCLRIVYKIYPKLALFSGTTLVCKLDLVSCSVPFGASLDWLRSVPQSTNSQIPP